MSPCFESQEISLLYKINGCLWYILPIGGLYAIYHLLGEPETTIDKTKSPQVSESKSKTLSKMSWWNLHFPASWQGTPIFLHIILLDI